MTNEKTMEKITYVEDLIAHKLIDLLIEITQHLSNHQVSALKSSLDEFYTTLEEINTKLAEVIEHDLPPAGIPRFDKQMLLRQIEELQGI
jgi:uncharacterized protein YaaR (DUF327 family)